MRLIDGDALEKFLSDAEMEATKRKKYVFASALNVIQGNVRNFPAIEPERKKGKWIDDGTELGCCCSECGVTLDDYFYGALYEVRLGKMPKFCPNCGAEMRGGEQR